MDPEVLVLDEPASNLGPGGRCGLIQLLQRLPLTEIIVAHDLEMVRTLIERTILVAVGGHEGVERHVLSLEEAAPTPSWVKVRHSTATSKLFPGDKAVPGIISTLAVI